MSQWEEVELMDATHVEINGVVHEITERGGTVERPVDFGSIDILVERSVDCYIDVNKWANIPKEAFPLLGIKPLRMVKPTPIEFEGITMMLSGYGLRYIQCPSEVYVDRKFRCVEIMEDEE
jgi:hypothetical protein